ncbi:short-chain dehydrogenase/reductase SDR [Emticicia oligotrophica DSM 17448]|uniref:Short-chain dehydrogenase/reductase SDR n=1 Tax=Emticicia oligotrophica (strain DSM 17448 / CIP 109782 / MTCC 6937 / GPTSA100-15) TaxID=929562 RepID=A0ABN4ART4_EMTOG|nr:SDR family oxidoreductase [Emticicia oligotrophica]AFK05309.1 short-chain dehydrogenase/reductase SDR [Emticicia oligotrophica DSM 17448]
MLKDKVVIITGGSSGIGKALAFELGKEKCKLIITGRNNDKLEQTSHELSMNGIENHYIVADSSLEYDNKRIVAEAIYHYGKIDIVINNAGITMRSMFEDADIDATIRKVMDINFFGTVYLTQAALPYIKKAKGTIVGISSIAGFRGLPVRSGYSASKFAVNGFLEALRTELLYSGVNVLTACPGFTSSNIRFAAIDGHGEVSQETVRDEEKMMSAEECAIHIVKAIKKRKRSIVLTKEGKLTVWLNKLFPSLVDRLVYTNLSKEKNSPLKQASQIA